MVLDDAFQHWPLGRDLNIVTIDSSNSFGNGHLLPAGILREPLSALKRADVFFLTKIDGTANLHELSSRLKTINPQALIVESLYTSALLSQVFDSRPSTPGYFNNKRVCGFCAIGDPFSFEMILKKTGAQVLKMFTFMDHHVYNQEDLQMILDYSKTHDVLDLVTTHKDAVKLQEFKDLLAGVNLFYVPIRIEITKGADEFLEKIIAICRH